MCIYVCSDPHPQLNNWLSEADSSVRMELKKSCFNVPFVLIMLEGGPHPRASSCTALPSSPHFCGGSYPPDSSLHSLLDYHRPSEDYI